MALLCSASALALWLLLLLLLLLWCSAVTLPRAGLDVPPPPLLHADYISGGVYGHLRGDFFSRLATSAAFFSGTNSDATTAAAAATTATAATAATIHTTTSLAPIWWLVDDFTDVLRHAAGLGGADLGSRRQLFERRRDRATLALHLPLGHGSVRSDLSSSSAGSRAAGDLLPADDPPSGWTSARLQTHLRTRLGQLRRHGLAPSARFIREHLGLADRRALVAAVARILSAERALADAPWARLLVGADDSTLDELDVIRQNQRKDVRLLVVWAFLVVGGVAAGLVVLRRWQSSEMARRRESWGWGASFERPQAGAGGTAPAAPAAPAAAAGGLLGLPREFLGNIGFNEHLWGNAHNGNATAAAAAAAAVAAAHRDSLLDAARALRVRGMTTSRTATGRERGMGRCSICYEPLSVLEAHEERVQELREERRAARAQARRDTEMRAQKRWRATKALSSMWSGLRRRMRRRPNANRRSNREAAAESPSDSESDPEPDVDPATKSHNLLTLTSLSCGHCFHQQCIDRWLVSKRRNDCPLCRAVVV